MKSHPFKASSYDAIVIGARCGGAATAMLLARAGLRVLAIDRQVYGSDTLSTHALMRPAVVQLARWGVLERIVAKSTPVITSTSFHYGADDVVSVPIQADAAIPGLVAPRRTVLDRTLVDAALEAGAEVVHEVIAQELLRDRSDRVVGVKVGCADGDLRSLNASIVVGADGLGSIVARQVGARTIYSGQSSAATIYIYTDNPGLNGFHWYFGERSAAGIIPTNDDKVCVFVATPDERMDRATHLGLADRHIGILRGLVPSMAEHIAVSGCSTPRGFRGAAAILRQAYGPGWLLVGDSGLFRDPITAHGISDALRDAEGAARAILAGSYRDLSLYQEQRDTLARPVMQATEGICGFDWNVSQLKELHQQLSAAMKHEVTALVDGPLHPFAPEEPSASDAESQQNVVSPIWRI